ncbi:alpha/beta hydrolase [Thalassotalea insulae]|uniref:Alpha/beta hydrolase n=1 Tax=Thalassotalea insulae TaxID=2056778 RepID=A0ABQ6GR63_9GAMM|nr:alpha/beta hydrolase [Thalassotalea insulae]GLX77679.1 alpha/beta hydrolase [Thalassotalea insulae]
MDIYFLPGTMCDQRLWSNLVEELEGLTANSFHYHFLTLARSQTIDEIVDDVKRQLPQRPIVLVGFSLGGYLASAFAVKYPHNIDKLVVLSNVPSALPQQEIKHRSRTISWIKRHGYNGIPTQRVLDLLAPSAHRNNAVIKLIKAMDAALGKEVLLQQLQATTLRENLAAKLKRLACNKYFAVGDKDTLASAELLKQMANEDVGMQLTVFAGTGHMLPLEQPKQLALWLAECLENFN